MCQVSRILLLLLLLQAAASGEEAEVGDGPIDGVAKRVLAAARADDTKALQALAAQDHPDPWLVADALEARRAHEEARRFALAAPRIDVKGLPAYLATASKRKAPSDVRKRFAAASAAFAAEENEKVLEHLDGLDPPGPSVLAVQVHTLRGKALHALGRYAQAESCFVSAADMAEQLEWWTQASDTLYLAGLTYDYRDDGKGMHRLFERHLDIEERLQSKMGQGRAHYRLGNAHIVLRQWEAARRHQQISLAMAQAVHDHEYVAKALANDAVLCFQADPTKALGLAERAVTEIDRVDAAGLATRFHPDRQRVAGSKADMLLLAASAAAKLGRQAEAETHAAAAVAAAESSANGATVREARAFLAVVEGERRAAQGRDSEALEAYERAHVLYGSFGEAKRVEDAGVLRRMATACAALGDLPRAHEHLQSAFALLRSIPSAERLRCHLHIHAASVTLRLGRGAQALAHLQTAEKLTESLGDARLQVDVLLGRSRYHASRTEFAAAVTLVRRALAALAGSEHQGARGRAHLTLGQLYRDMGSPERAAAEIKLAVEDLRASGDARNLWTARLVQAFLLQADGDLDGARRLLTELRAEQKALENLRGVAWAEMGLANVERAAGLHGKAAKHREAALRLFERLGAGRTATFARVQLGVHLVWAGAPERGQTLLTQAHEEARVSGDIWALAYSCMGLAHAPA